MTSRPSSRLVWLLGLLLTAGIGLWFSVGRLEGQTTPASGLRFQQGGVDQGRGTVLDCSTGLVCSLLGSVWTMTSTGGGGGGAPTTAPYITQVPDAGLSAEQALSLLATGYMVSTTTTGVITTQTATQVTAALNLFTSALQGLVPLSGGGTANFLRADGNWAAPAGGGNVTAGTLTTNALVLGSGATAIVSLGSLGTTTMVLHGNAAGAPTFGQVVSGDLNITTTSCTNQAVTAISAGGVGTCTTVTNAMLANSAITVTGTANQISVSGSPVSLGGTVTLSTPQNIHAAATPTFASMTLSADTNQLVLGTTNTMTLTMAALGASRIFTLPNANSNSVIPDAGAANSFLTAISAAGVISKAQPAFTNLSGSATCAQLPALTGPVTTPGGSCATTIGANTVTLGMLATQADLTLLANISGGAAVPTASLLTSILDAVFGTTQGAVIYRNATVWTTLGPGTNGQFLQTAGAAANPVWATLAGGGNVSNTGTPTNGQLALWTNATTIQGLTALPAANFPALTGPVTTVAGGLGTTIAANAITTTHLTDANVTLAKIVSASAASVLLGRGSASGAGVYQEITLGAGLTMTNQVLSASGAGATITTFATDLPADQTAESTSINSLTTRQVKYFTLPGAITLNSLSLAMFTTTTAGTLKLCIYSGDGATKHVDVTTGAPSSGAVLTTAVGSVVLPAGEYYAAYGCASTCSNTVRGAPVEAGSVQMYGAFSPAGKKKWHGNVTHTSGTCNSTLGTITGTTAIIPAMRGDE